MVFEDAAVLSAPTSATPTPAHPFTVNAIPGDTTSAVTGVAGDAGFQRLLTGDEPPRCEPRTCWPGLAVVERELPTRQRGITIVNPSDGMRPSAFVAAMVDGLRGNPFVRPVTVERLLSEVPVPDGPGAHDHAAGTGLGTGEREPVRERARRTSARSATSSAPAPRSSTAANAALVRVDLVGLADARGAVRAAALLDGIAGRSTASSPVSASPTSTTVTITSSRAEVPITFQNDTGQPVKVHVSFESDKLLFPEGTERDFVLPPRNTTFRIAVETRSSGTFPIGVTLTTAGDTRFPIQTTQLRIRSTFVSGVGIFLTVAAILFLALWWGWDIRKRHRREVRRARRSGRARRWSPSGRRSGASMST